MNDCVQIAVVDQRDHFLETRISLKIYSKRIEWEELLKDESNVLKQSEACCSLISNVRGRCGECVGRSPKIKLPTPPSPRNQIDSKIVKLFLNRDEENFSSSKSFVLRLPNGEKDFVFRRVGRPIRNGENHLFVRPKFEAIRLIDQSNVFRRLKNEKIRPEDRLEEEENFRTVEMENARRDSLRLATISTK